jgi:hypothetical protein
MSAHAMVFLCLFCCRFVCTKEKKERERENVRRRERSLGLGVKFCPNNLAKRARWSATRSGARHDG